MVIVLPTADIQKTTSSHRSTNKRSITGTITHLIYNQLFHYILNLLPWLESWWFNGISLSSDSKVSIWFECAFKWEKAKQFMVSEHYSHCLDCCFGLVINLRYSRLLNLLKARRWRWSSLDYIPMKATLHLHPWLGLVNIVVGGLRWHFNICHGFAVYGFPHLIQIHFSSTSYS